MIETTPAPFTVAPLADDCPFGAQVFGVPLDRLGEESVAAALRELWIREGVLVFRGVQGAAEQVALSRCFGTPQRHPFRESWVDGMPELVNISHVPGEGSVYRVDGEARGAWLPWHYDLAYMAKINRGGILRPLELPEHGGRTGFIDQIAAYDRLPDTLKAEIADLHVVYTMDLNASHMRYGRPAEVELIRGGGTHLAILAHQFEYPRVVHPLVYHQAETGRKVLHVSPWFAVGILERGGPAGEQLLHDVIESCIDPANAYFHDWRADDMVLWDNWRTLHCATGVDPAATRRMQRTTIAGDNALGRALEADMAALATVDV
jgi:taurine dioxygenase